MGTEIKNQTKVVTMWGLSLLLNKKMRKKLKISGLLRLTEYADVNKCDMEGRVKVGDEEE